jgi:DNA-binding MarR family transcriptional regulator
MTDGSAPRLDFLTFPQHALQEARSRLPELDADAMRLVLLLHRVTNALVYDLESSVHRPRGWSWAGFRLLFVLWISGPVEGKQAAALSGMSRAAVSNLVNTLDRAGLVCRETSPTDARAVLLSLTPAGAKQFDDAFGEHNAREREWAALLTRDERRQLITLLAKLSHGARSDWVNRRD